MAKVTVIHHVIFCFKENKAKNLGTDFPLFSSQFGTHPLLLYITVLAPVNAHADILDLPKAKGLCISVESALGPPPKHMSRNGRVSGEGRVQKKSGRCCCGALFSHI